MEKIKIDEHPILAKIYLKNTRLLMLNIFIFALISTLNGAIFDDIFSQYLGLISSILLFPMILLEIIAESIYSEALEKEKERTNLLKSL